MTEISIPQVGNVVPTSGVKEAIHIGERDLSYIDVGDGSFIQLLQVDLNQGLWVLKVKFPAGYVAQKHYHTGQVFGVTLSGSWYYKEYPASVYSKGSYLYEPAQSVHTLVVPEGNTEMTEVWFAVNGANINLDDSGNVVSLLDAQGVLGSYRAACNQQGLSYENLIVLGE